MHDTQKASKVFHFIGKSCLLEIHSQKTKHEFLAAIEKEIFEKFLS